MEITGRVRVILPEQRFAGRNGEVVRYGFVIDTAGQYSHAVCFNVLGVDRWAKISPNVVVGNDVSVGFDVSSREWSGRWFTQCDAFRVTCVADNSGNAAASVVSSQPFAVPVADVKNSVEEKKDNELPF